MSITDELERLSKLHTDGTLSDIEFEQAKSRLLSQSQAPPGANYEILPDGRKRFLKATPVDIIVSIILPFWGLAIGGYAYFGKGETKRGATRMIIGAIVLFLCIIATFAPQQR